MHNMMSRVDESQSGSMPPVGEPQQLSCTWLPSSGAKTSSPACACHQVRMLGPYHSPYTQVLLGRALGLVQHLQ